MDEQHDPAYARAPEPQDLVRLCRALNGAGARYVLIGGFAVIAHGRGRFTKDIDLLVDDAPENVDRHAPRRGYAGPSDRGELVCRDDESARGRWREVGVIPVFSSKECP